MRNLLAKFFILSLLVSASAAAQGIANNVNPEALEFDSPLLFEPGITGYRVEIFMAGADPAADIPVKSFDVGVHILDNGKVRVALAEAMLDVPNGRYVATIRGTGDTPTIATAASDPFVWSRPGTPTDRVEAARQERFWTKVALAIAAGLLALPFLF